MQFRYSEEKPESASCKWNAERLTKGKPKRIQEVIKVIVGTRFLSEIVKKETEIHVNLLFKAILEMPSLQYDFWYVFRNTCCIEVEKTLNLNVLYVNFAYSG